MNCNSGKTSAVYCQCCPRLEVGGCSQSTGKAHGYQRSLLQTISLNILDEYYYTITGVERVKQGDDHHRSVQRIKDTRIETQQQSALK